MQPRTVFIMPAPASAISHPWSQPKLARSCAAEHLGWGQALHRQRTVCPLPLSLWEMGGAVAFWQMNIWLRGWLWLFTQCLSNRGGLYIWMYRIQDSSAMAECLVQGGDCTVAEWSRGLSLLMLKGAVLALLQGLGWYSLLSGPWSLEYWPKLKRLHLKIITQHLNA